MWKLVASSRPLADRFLTVRADTCVLPSGQTVEPYYVLEFPDWINVLALTPSGDAVLVRQYRHGLRRHLLELPCGAIEGSETPKAAVERELLEETGYVPGSLVQLGSVSPNPANHNNLTHCFLATDCLKVSEPLGDPNEPLEVVTLPLPELLARAGRGEIVQALHLASLFLALGPLGKSPLERS